MDNILTAFLLTLFAGLATGIGSLAAFFTQSTNKRFLSFALGFSAGVMLYVSFVEILPKAIESLSETHTENSATIFGVLSFFVGIGIIALIDRFIPCSGDPHMIISAKDAHNEEQKSKLMRMGIFTALAIAIHNFPEGIATFMSAIQDPGLGVSVAIAIAIHNIPEGIAVAIPVFYATGSRKKAFRLSFLSGISEPVGAIVGYFLIVRFFPATVFGYIFAAVAGIMVYISLDELLPSAQEYGEHHISILGLVSGMALMAISLILFM